MDLLACQVPHRGQQELEIQECQCGCTPIDSSFIIM